MSKTFVYFPSIFMLLICVSASENHFSGCNCEIEGFFGYKNIMETQRLSDFLIAIAYFSIPIELLYFVSCSNVPFKWVLFQFISFIVLCGMTHLLTGWTHPTHPFQLMLALTVFKFLTALVSFATAITLITLIPLLLKVKVREFMLKKKFSDLGQEMGMIQKQNEAGWHVRMLTHEIRKSLDRHTILYTTLERLSETLDLQNCVVWMPDKAKTVMNLTHRLKSIESSVIRSLCIPINDSDVQEIKKSEVVKLLEPKSRLAVCSSGSWRYPPGAVAAIRMPMLRVADFKGGTTEIIQACYAILVLVLPGGNSRSWSAFELEIVKVVADQVAVALSHAAVLEESQLMRDKLVVQNRALQQARHDAMRAGQARTAFQTVMSHGLRKPMYSIMGLLSILQDENPNGQLVDSMVKTSNVLSMLVNDVIDDSSKEDGKFLLETRSFQLRGMVKEAACVARCLCVYKGYEFEIDVDKYLPENVIGDERRVFQVILHMVGNLLRWGNRGGCLTLKICRDSGSHGRSDQQWRTWRSNSNEGYVVVKFEIGINDGFSVLERSSGDQRSRRVVAEESLSFSMCRKLVQMMQGNIWVVPNPVGFDQSMSLVLRFQLRPSIMTGVSDSGEPSDHHPQSNSIFRGLQVLLADEDNVNRAVTRKLLEKLGCVVTAVTSGFDCLTAVSLAVPSYQILIVDLQMPDFNGFEVASRIRDSRNRNWPLIIASTASADVDLWERCLPIGINGIIQKPILLQGIADELRRVLIQADKIL